MGFCSNADSRDNKIITNENKITNEEIKELITAYNEDILKIIKKEKSTISYDEIESILKRYRYFTKDCENLQDYLEPENDGRIELPLCDGDYAVWNSKMFDREGPFYTVWKGRKAVQYAAEYHANRALMGIVKMKKIDKEKYAFYEYRINTPENGFANLKHILIYYNTDNPITFIATANGEIKGIKYNNKVFSVSLSNIAEIQDIDLSSLNTPNHAYDALNIAGYGVMGITAAIAAPLSIVIWPALMVGFIVNEKIQQK